MVGPGGCSCGEEEYCRSGSQQITTTLDACVQAAIASNALSLEHDGAVDCWIHMQAATGSNNYSGVTCYALDAGIYSVLKKKAHP